MGSLTIFSEASSVPTVRRQSKLLDKMGSSVSLRRIATNTNGTFKRIVGGEQVGKAVAHELEIIIVDLLPEVSREYYATEYDPDAKPTLPDCWSNDGKTPDAKAKAPQSASCAKCPLNVDGSGNKGKGRACRFKRRVAVLVAGDPSGEVYQMSFAATSLFGKGVDNVHPFESYKNFLKANGEGLDTVVTRVMYDLEADTMRLKFQPVRHLTETEADFVEAAQDDPETQKYINLTVGEMDGAKPAVATQPKTVTVSASKIEAPKPKAGNPFEAGDDEDEAPAPEVTKRASKKPAAAREVGAEAKGKLSSVLAAWGADEDEE